jgi:hypothetical protein
LERNLQKEIWLPSGRAEENERRRNFASASEIQVRGWVPRKGPWKIIAKILQISEPSLDVTSAACPFIG